MAGFTVIGGAGFIGSALVLYLEEEGHACRATSRGERLEDESDEGETGTEGGGLIVISVSGLKATGD